MLLEAGKSTLSDTVRSTTKWLYIIFTSIILILGVVYLLHSNRTATDGYQLLLLEQERTRLLIEKEQWDTKLSSSLSVINMEKSNNLQMTKPQKVSFYREDSSVASVFEQTLN